MRTMDVNGVWKNCMYREVMSEQELRAVPIEPSDEGTAAPVCRVRTWPEDESDADGRQGEERDDGAAADDDDEDDDGEDDDGDTDENDEGDDDDDDEEEEEDVGGQDGEDHHGRHEEDDEEIEGEEGRNEGGGALLGAVRPLVARIFAQFRDALETLLPRHPDAPVSEAIGVQVFLSGLARQVLGIIAPTLLVELNAARANGSLRGETVDTRFHNFLDDLDDESRAPTLLRQYPALAQLLRAVLTARADARLECVRHLCEDWPAIQECWPALSDARLAGVAAAVGDPQCGGRTTLLLDFEPEGLLIYRPRSIAVDVHFQELLQWLNARGANPAFGTLRMLERGDHGWIEAIPSGVCDSNEATVRFHERVGGSIALLHVLGAADLTSVHLVARGEHPVLVDAESLFQSRARHRPGGRASDQVGGDHIEGGNVDGRRVDGRHVEGAAGGRLAVRGLAQSVLRVGLLPRVGPCDALEAIAPGHLIPVSDVVAVERGFARMYRLLWALRPLLVKDDGPLGWFGRDRVRVSLRPAAMYGAFLLESTSPEVLRDGVERERLFDRLWEDVDGEPELARVVHAERDDLEHGDLPCFTTRPGSCAIWTSSGMELPGFYDRSALDEVVAHLERLGDDDLERQRWLLRVSLGASRSRHGGVSMWSPEPIAMDAENGPKRRVPIGPLMAPPLDPEEYVDEAARVARRLERLAFVDGVRASWVGLMAPHGGARWSIAPLGLELGDGMSGVALFLARLASVTGQPRHRLLAEQAAVSVIETIDMRREHRRPAAVRLSSDTERASIGAFTGWGGVIYVLAHLGVLLESSDYVDRADALVPLVEELIDGDEVLDINDGAAGAIMGLAALHAVKPSDRLLSVIRACTSRLLVRAERLPIGYGWRPPAASSHPPRIGFPEGAAGIALALLAASELTNDPAAHDIAHHAIEYERSAFVPATKNWPELLSDSPQDGPSVAGVPAVVPVVSMTTWCRGAPGIGLGRLAGLRYLDYWRVRSEILDAVKATVRGGFGGSHCLCHGDLGSVEFLAVAAARFGDVPLRRDVAQIAAGVMRGIDERGWRCGTPGEVETPGYLTGLAGIGDGLLRVAEPRLPSVLMLEAPASPGVRAARGRRQSPDEGGAATRAMREEIPVPVVVRQP